WRRRMKLQRSMSGIAVLLGLAVCAAGQTGVAAGADKQAQVKRSAFSAAVDAEITNLEKQLVPVAEAMPEDKFDFTPEALNIAGSELKGVRTFAAQVRHVAADN